MGDLTGAVDEDAVVGAHAGVDHADIRRHEADFGEGGGVGERGRGLLLGREDDSVGGLGVILSAECEGKTALLRELAGHIPLIPTAVTPWLTAFRAYSAMLLEQVPAHRCRGNDSRSYEAMSP